MHSEANEASGDAVRLTRSSCSNKRGGPLDTATDEHSRANVLRVAFNCVLWSDRMLVVRSTAKNIVRERPVNDIVSH